MIWLEFHKPGVDEPAPSSRAILEPGLLNIEVHTRPPIDGLTVIGSVTFGGQKTGCEFQFVADGVYRAPFEPLQPGVYQVTVTAGGGGYRELTLSGELYCRW